jgi:undecaprenyl-diphosphatase
MEALQAYDLGILYAIGSLHRPWLDGVMMTLSHLGGLPAILGAAVLAVAAFLLLRRPRFAGVIVLVTFLALALEHSAKDIVERERPNVNWRLVDLPTESSFPSGHALRAMAVYGCIGLLAARLLARRWRWLPVAAGFGLGVVIGFTRVYLGVHYPLDILGGWIAGLACALLGSALAGTHQPAPEPVPVP